MNHSTTITRRQALALGAGGLLAAGLWPGALRAEGERGGDPFFFLAINDLHYLDKRCTNYLAGAFQQMKSQREKPEFLLVIGDLVDNGKPEQLGAVRDLIKDFGLPVYAVIGNHDYRVQDDRKSYEELFPGRLNYHFEHKGWQFLGLDSTDGVRYKDVAAPDATLRFLDGTLPKLDRKKPTVVFTHFPLGPKVNNRLTNADAVLERFKDHNLRAVLGGHYHAFTERTVGNVTLTTNRCCSFSKNNHDGSKEKGYFLCHARDGVIQRTFVEYKPA
jgi:3',5'-cyclic AMP phosphodiesterase CpdA